MKVIRRSAAVFLAVLLFMASLPAALAVGEDAFLTVLVNNAPADLTVSLVYPEDLGYAPVRLEQDSRGWETCFRYFYSGVPVNWRNVRPEGTELRVEGNGESFVCPLTEEQRHGRHMILTLDVASRSLQTGEPAGRAVLLTVLRVGGALLLQLLLFFLLGYRKPRSWLIFSAAAVISQLLLNLLFLRGHSSLADSYLAWIFVVWCLAAAFLLVIESFLFGGLFLELRERRAVLCAVMANAVCLAEAAAVAFFLPL